MADALVFLLFLLAIAAGFALGVYQGQYYTRRGWRRFIPKKQRKKYFTELSQLLSGESDAGIETFTQHFKVTQETVEIHFAVGDVLRKRGEVEKATQIHQNILASDVLDEGQAELAQLSLARDYLAAGLLDRAEVLLKPLSSADTSPIKVKSLAGLASIYEQEQEWHKAINVLAALCKYDKRGNEQSWRELQAHFYCELALEALNQKNWQQVDDLLRNAIDVAPRHARANSLLVALYGNKGQVIKAVQALTKIIPGKGNADEMIDLIATLELSTEQKVEVRRWLSASQKVAPSLAKALYLADEVLSEHGDAAALERLCAELSFDKALTQTMHVSRNLPNSNLQYSSLKQCLLTEVTPSHICGNCGFESQQFYWRCPTCKTWH